MACNNSDDILIKKIHEVNLFNSIRVSGGINLEIVNGEQSVVVETTTNNHSIMEVLASENTLIIQPKNNIKPDENTQVKVHIAVNDLVCITVLNHSVVNANLSGYITHSALGIMCSENSKVNGTFEYQSFFLSLNESSSADIHVKCDYLDVTAINESKVTLSGSTENSSFELDNDSELNVFNLNTDNVEISMINNCTAEVAASGTISGSITDSKLSYKDIPTINVIANSDSNISPL